jgi:hypothetical protein
VSFSKLLAMTVKLGSAKWKSVLAYPLKKTLLKNATVPPGPHPVKLQSAKFKNRNTNYKNSEYIQVLYIGLKMNFLLIQPRCQISKRLYGESKPCDSLRTAPSRQTITNSNQPSRRVTQVRNRDKINHLPLIFIWLHSEDINLLNKCLFCSIKSLFISKNLHFVHAFSTVIHRFKHIHNRQAKKSILYP